MVIFKISMNINGESKEKNEEAYEELTCQVCNRVSGIRGLHKKWQKLAARQKLLNNGQNVRIRKGQRWKEPL